jgi:carbon monoxide dehydrogenase subunit G
LPGAIDIRDANPKEEEEALVELDHSFTSSKPLDDLWRDILDLEKLVPAVEGGRVVEKTGPESVKAEILVRMGAMSMTFAGSVEVVEQDDAAHRAVMRVKSKETGGTGYANADVTFTLSDGGGTVHTAAQITGKAASMGERADQRLHRQARDAVEDGRRWRGERCARSRLTRYRSTAAPRSRRIPAGRCSAATAPTTTSAQRAGTCSRSAWTTRT